MTLLVILGIMYIMTFIAFLLFVYRGEKKDPTDGSFSLGRVILTAALLALIPTIVIGLFLFAILGSTNLVTTVFDFEISAGRLMILSVAFLIYLFTIDSIVEVLAEHLFGKERIVWPGIFMFLSRAVIFYGIGELVGIALYPSLVIAVGVAAIVVMLEVLYLKSKQKKNADS
ncbi:hypothetical protein [Lentibacillus sp. JNUCC-1]|uniref:hypothetical protein n=1 Tax=Lentibacillus sp. JNUCC-1 TaxID=2654513 RepID=UPI0012E848EE|nr:hypothetical protein [Lentibacillus sp. JNUCC-1]